MITVDIAKNMLVDTMVGILGADGVTTEAAECIFFSTDTLREGVVAEAVIRPADADQLARAIAAATTAGRSVIGRGGGFSYTGGYTPAEAGSIIVDTRRMNRILEVNEEDLYVVVEAGCTWKALYEELKGRGFRTPYFGPMSGFHTTIGGALSQGSFFLGSTQFGTTADSVLALEVALADGQLVRTGSSSNRFAPSPFFRAYGPDLTGLFLHDSGAMGIKTKAMLRLIPYPEYSRFASFHLPDLESTLALMSTIARSGHAAECYAWDPALVQKFRSRNTVTEDLRYLKNVARSGGSFFKGVRDAAKLVMAGKKMLDGVNFLIHVAIDDMIEGNAEAKLVAVREIAAAFGAAESDGTMPQALRSGPFSDFLSASVLGPEVRSLPMSGLFPHSKALEAARTAYDHFDGIRAEMDANGITVGTIFFAVGPTVLCVEPIVNWTDTRAALHDRKANRSDVAALAADPGPPAATEIVARERAALADKFLRLGAAWIQIGKTFPYAAGREPEALALVRGIKDLVDPENRINPGALGL